MAMTRLEGKVNMSGRPWPFCFIAMIGILLCSPADRALAAVKEAKLPPLVIAHWMPQLRLGSFDHPGFSRDLPMMGGPMHFRGDMVPQMREAKRHGIDVFAICNSQSIDWNRNMWEAAMTAADQVEGFHVIPCLCGGADNRQPAQALYTLPAAIDWIKTARRHKSALMVDGKYVLNGYEWWGTTGAAVKEFRDKIREATGEEVFLMIDIDGAWLNPTQAYHDLSRTPVDKLRDLIGSLDMAYHFWGRWHPIYEQVAGLCREEGVYFAGTSQPEHLRDFLEIWSPSRHTAKLRNNLAKALELKTPWIHITTWNDYLEHSHVQPSAAWGDTRAAIVKFYSDISKGQTPEERFFITSPSEARLGIPLKIEVLTLRDSEKPCPVRVWLTDRNGVEVASWTGETAAGRDSSALAEFTLQDYPAGRWVRPHVEFSPAGGKKTRLDGAPVNVWPDVDRGIPSRQMFSLSDRSSDTTRNLSLSYLEETPDQGRIIVNVGTSNNLEFSPWAEIHLMYGEMALKRFTPGQPLEMEWPLKDHGLLPILKGFYGGNNPIHPRTLRSGFVTPRMITTDNTIVYGDPIWFGPRPGEKLEATLSAPMTELRDDMILDRSVYANHLRVGNREAVSIMEENGVARGLRVSPDSKLWMECNQLPTGAFTLGMSLSPDALGERQSILSQKSSPDYGGTILELSILPDGKLELIRDNSAAVSTKSLQAGRWNEIQLTFDGEQLSFQINGEEAGNQRLESPSTKGQGTPFYREMLVLPGRIYPRNRTSLAGSFHGGIADFSITSGTAPAEKPDPHATELVSLQFENTENDVTANRGTLGGGIPLPTHRGLNEDVPSALQGGKSLSPHQHAKTVRSSFELPALDAGTVMFWAKTRQSAGQQWWNVIDIGKKFNIYYNRTNLILRSNDGRKTAAMDVALPADDQWRHYAFVLNAARNAGRVFVDGKEVKTVPLSVSLAGGAMSIAAGRDLASANFEGQLADIRVFGRALSPEEIARSQADLPDEANAPTTE